jgi:phytoene dehydrogenase-like protein
MTCAYDLIVIGSGTAVGVTSHRMASAGWKVAVIDHRPFGGTCALRPLRVRRYGYIRRDTPGGRVSPLP